jgi:uncharacterized membrane protein
MPSEFVLGARDWLLAALILGCAISVAAIWSYVRRGTHQFGANAMAMLAKIVAVCALAFCLLEPMRRSERPRPGANLMAIVVDNSRSMEIRPPGQSGVTIASYLEKLKQALSKESPWQTRLAQDFDARRYCFDQRLRAVDDLADLPFDGNHSAMADALATLNSRFAARPVAGVLLFTDGLATDDLSRLDSIDFKFPVYPVVNDEPLNLQDVSVSEPSVTISSFELAPATIEATVRCVGLTGEGIAVRLFDSDGSALEKQTIDCDQPTFEKRVRFQYQPKSPGLQFVRVRATLLRDDTDQVQADSRREVTTANNSQLVTIDRGGGPFRILYVAGRPNWEFKFLRRALEEDVEIKLKGLIRMANKEPKFVFGDRGVDSTNPLFSGFTDNAETAEQYDEPVLIRIGVEDEDELKAGFPKTEEVLYKYHAIILDDVEAKFFSQAQMLLLRQFVAERGGGLMMLGGQEMFLSGDYNETPLGDVLPVYLRGNEQARDKSSQVRYRLTREGGLEPWLRLRANEPDERQRVAEMPDFQTWNAITDVKPGASVLAQLSAGDQMTQPGLVVQRFGKGRSAALLVGDMWRWSLRRAQENTDDLAQSWRQMARWLTADVPRSMEVDVQPPASTTEPNRIVVQLRDAAFKPMDNANVQLTVQQPNGQEISLAATADRTKQGQYVAEFWSQMDGAYRCRVEATGPDLEEVGFTECGWTAQPSSAEFARVEPDIETLNRLASRTGGETVGLDELDQFVQNFPASKVPITESHVEPFWHQPWLLLLAIGCLCVEWGIRRIRGLP